jgi:ChaB
MASMSFQCFAFSNMITLSSFVKVPQLLTFDWKPASLEEVAHKVAWAAVKKEYEKDRRTGAWKRKETWLKKQYSSL